MKHDTALLNADIQDNRMLAIPSKNFIEAYVSKYLNCSNQSSNRHCEN